MKKSIILVLFISVFVLLGSVHSASALANPASVKCVEDGGTSSIQTKSDGSQYSNCNFPDGSACEEWAYYRGECTSKKVSLIDQLPASCISAFDGCNSCSRINGGQWACTKMACTSLPTMIITPNAYCKKFQITNPDPVMCPANYAPVCGDISDRVRCITAPCIAQKTYSNECMMNADGAKKVSDGECKSDSIKPSFCNASYIKLVRGSKGDYVRGLQEYLRNQGYNPGTIDGVFGRQVVAAVKLFQKAYGLGVDGIFGMKSKMKICSNITPIAISNPVYTVTITADQGPQLVGGSAQFKTVEIYATGLTAPKLVDIAITYNSYAIVPNPVITTQVKNLSMNLDNGQNRISQVPLGPILSVTIDGKNVPFTQ